MSNNESTFPTQGYQTNSTNTTVLSLNDVFRESMKKAQAEVNNLQVIVRCESLPQIEGAYEAIVQLFDTLLDMILKHPPKNSRLFLYVDCEEEQESTLTGKRYIIKFNTNIAIHENWKMINSEALFNCRQILSAHNGTLVVNNISSTGCLFILSLPGKME